MNLNYRSTKKTNLSVFMFLITCSLLSPVMAQKQAIKQGQEAKEMIDEVKETEKELRQQLIDDIQEKREDTLDYLLRLERKYRRNDKKDEANSIKNEIIKLEEKIAKNKPIEPPNEQPKEANKKGGNDYVIFEKKYIFKEDKISGFVTFKKDNKAVFTYKLNGEKQESTFTVQPKSNHLFLDTKSDLGKIYISEIPSTERLAIMIRWGGSIKHEISTASIK